MIESISKAPLTKSRLSELALDAAIELDRTLDAKLLNENSAVARFFKVLREQVENGGQGALKDQTLIPVYSLAVSRSKADSFVPREDLAEIIKDIIQKHEAVTSDTASPATAQVDFLRDFCLSVHEALILGLMTNRATANRNDDRARYG